MARTSNAAPALTAPLRTGSPAARSASSGSPVRADSSRTAGPRSTRPSTGSTSPGADDHQVPDDDLVDRGPPTPRHPRAVALYAAPARATRAGPGSPVAALPTPEPARSPASPRSARRPGTRPPPRCPANASTAIRSTPSVRRTSASTTHPTAGTTATTVPAAQNSSADRAAPTAHATPPAASRPTVTSSNPRSNHRCATGNRRERARPETTPTPPSRRTPSGHTSRSADASPPSSSQRRDRPADHRHKGLEHPVVRPRQGRPRSPRGPGTRRSAHSTTHRRAVSGRGFPGSRAVAASPRAATPPSAGPGATPSCNPVDPVELLAMVGDGAADRLGLKTSFNKTGAGSRGELVATLFADHGPARHTPGSRRSRIHRPTMSDLRSPAARPGTVERDEA